MTRELFRRIAKDRRHLVVPIVAALVANTVVAVAWVVPKAQVLAGVESRAAAAQHDAQRAQDERQQAAAASDRYTQAQRDLDTFYTRTLPTSLSDARRQTYVALAELAADADLRIERRQEEVEVPRTSERRAYEPLTRLVITMVMRGDYESVRQFLSDVEHMPAFVSIDTVSLAEGPEPGAPLVLSVVLSTWYRAGQR